MVVLSILANKLIIYLIIGGLSALLFYMLIFDDLKRTAVLVEVGRDGVYLHFKLGKSRMILWAEMTGWSQYKSLGVDSCIGIWKKNKVYNFDKETARTILNRYVEFNGGPLKQRMLR